MRHTLKWFTNRISKRVYRDYDGCDCRHCQETVKNGLIISDETHARYMFDMQNDYYYEGTKLNYRDKKLKWGEFYDKETDTIYSSKIGKVIGIIRIKKPLKYKK